MPTVLCAELSGSFLLERLHWIVWCMHVSCIDSDVQSYLELRSALSQSSWSNNNNILYSSQREIKAVVRSHNEDHTHS